MKTFSCLLFILLLSLEATSQQPNLRPLAGSAPQSFTLSPDKLGDVSSSVNLFTGDLSFPINLVSLPGRNGLDVSVPIVYSSNVARQAKTWNAEAPTGVVGLGWSFDFPKILVDNKMTGTREDDTYYIAEGGGSNKLIYTGGTASTGKKYAAKNYQFWVITFYPNDEKWEIIKEDGTKYVYGDKNSGRSTVQWIVTWNNWIGDSNVTTSTIQKQQGLVWNLSEIINMWGEKIRFTYSNVNQKVGSAAGKEHTEASYLTTITDVLGRTVNLVYGNKGLSEYQEPHTENGTNQIDAYQERYEMKFLDHINVNDSDGVLLSSVDLAYTTMGTGDLTKRLLSSVVQYNSTGQSLPGHSFQYITSYSPTANFGALSAITTPTGGVINYTYAQQTIARAVREKKLTAPSGFKEPKVWIGPDYVVITWRQFTGSKSASSRAVRIQALTWDGEWLEWDLPNEEISNITVSQVYDEWGWASGNFGDVNKYKQQDFHVTLQRNFFAILYKSTATNVYSMRTYRKHDTRRGGWTKVEFYNLNLGDNVFQNSDLVSGENFVAVAGIRSDINIYRWNGSSWVTSTLTRNSGSDYKHNRLVAGHNYVISHSIRYNSPFALDVIKFYFFNEDGSVITRTPASLPDNITGDRSHWYTSSSFAAVMADDNQEYFYVWDENYNLTRKNLGYGLNDKSYVSMDNSMFTVVDPGVAANYAARYNGENFIISAHLDASSLSALNPNPFTIGGDFVLRPKSGSNNQVGLTYFNPNTNTWSNLTYATANKTTARAGYNFFVKTHSTDQGKAEIVVRRPNGTFITDPTSPTIANLNTNPSRFPWQVGYNFVIKNMGAIDASTFFATGESILLTNGKIDPSKIDFTTGTGFDTSGEGSAFHWTGDFDHTHSLVGGNTIVSFLNQLWQYNATEVKLFRLIDQAANGALTDFAVQKVSVNDGSTPTHSFLAYDLARATYDATGSIAQYNKVSVYPGVQFVDNSNGRTDYFFYNGIKSNEAAHPFSLSSDDDYSKILNGTSYRSNVLDKNLNLVSHSHLSTTVFSKVIQQGSAQVDFAYYARPKTTYQNVTGFYNSTIQIDFEYNANGLLREKDTWTGTRSFQEEFKYWYEEYDPSLTRNILTPVIQINHYVVSDLVGCSVIKYKNWGANNVPAPFQAYTWKKTGSSNFTAWALASTPSSDWRLTSTIDDMDAAKGLVKQTTSVDGTVTKSIWDAVGKYVIAQVTLPQNGHVIYNSFEDCASNCSAEAKTGLKSSNGTAFSYAGLPAGTYKVTYWRKASPQSDWEFVETSFTGTNYSIPHSWIDEVRIAPADARIVSYGYDRYGNVISVCDENNMISYKEYDEFNRPKITRDKDRKILGLTKYNISN